MSAKRKKRRSSVKASAPIPCFPGTSVSLLHSTKTLRHQEKLLRRCGVSMGALIDQMKTSKKKEDKQFVREIREQTLSLMDKLNEIREVLPKIHLRERKTRITHRKRRKQELRTLQAGKSWRKRKIRGRRVGLVRHYRNFFNWNNPALQRSCWCERKEDDS